MKSWATDIGNTYFEAKTKENVYIVGIPEFGELEGHTLVIFKAIYGLCSIGLRWHKRLSDTPRDMRFSLPKASDDIWMKKNDTIYEYLATYVNTISIAVKDLEEINPPLRRLWS